MRANVDLNITLHQLVEGKHCFTFNSSSKVSKLIEMIAACTFHSTHNIKVIFKICENNNTQQPRLSVASILDPFRIPLGTEFNFLFASDMESRMISSIDHYKIIELFLAQKIQPASAK